MPTHGKLFTITICMKSSVFVYFSMILVAIMILLHPWERGEKHLQQYNLKDMTLTSNKECIPTGSNGLCDNYSSLRNTIVHETRQTKPEANTENLARMTKITIMNKATEADQFSIRFNTCRIFDNGTHIRVKKYKKMHLRKKTIQEIQMGSKIQGQEFLAKYSTLCNKLWANITINTSLPPCPCVPVTISEYFNVDY